MSISFSRRPEFKTEFLNSADQTLGSSLQPLSPFRPANVIREAGAAVVDQVRSLSWEKRYVKMADVAPVQLLNEVSERLAALLQID